MKRINSVFLVLLASLVLAACSNHQQPAKAVAEEVIPVQVMKLQPAAANTTIPASGQFTTDDEVYLSFKTGGVIDHIYVKDGDAIKKGQLLASLKLTEINDQVQQASLQWEKAKRDYERTSNLYNDSVATLEQYQNAKTMVALSERQLDAAKFNLSYSEIRAEKNGFVLHKMANEGQLVSPGTAVLQTNGATSGAWLLRVGVSDGQWAAIAPGNTAIITNEANAGKEYLATVLRKSQGVNPATGMFSVDIQLAGNQPGAFASGMFGKAVITTSGDTAATLWKIPYAALLDADGSMGYVFVANNNSVSKARVTIAGMEKDSVLISAGLLHAATIVTTGNAYLTDNSTIRIIP